MKKISLFLLTTLLLTGCFSTNSDNNSKTISERQGDQVSMSTAILKTSMGEIIIELFPNQAPKTVKNFVDLATGAKEWTDPNIGEKVKTKLYDGTIFHRVIPGFMIQGGDPLGSGMGGPGYNFADEFHGELNFDIVTGKQIGRAHV